MNINALIKDGSDRDIYTFGGNAAWKTTTFRGYLVVLEWFVGAKSVEPMLCIQDAKRGEDSGMFGVCLSSIGVYADQSGGPSPGALAACKRALPVLGKAPIDMEAKALLDVVLQFTPDLIMMPPAPVAVRQEEVGRPLIEVELKNEADGKVEREVSL